MMQLQVKWWTLKEEEIEEAEETCLEKCLDRLSLSLLKRFESFNDTELNFSKYMMFANAQIILIFKDFLLILLFFVFDGTKGWPSHVWLI